MGLEKIKEEVGGRVLTKRRGGEKEATGRSVKREG